MSEKSNVKYLTSRPSFFCQTQNNERRCLLWEDTTLLFINHFAVLYTDLLTCCRAHPSFPSSLSSPRIGLTMKHSSSMKRCAADSVRKECAADNSLNRGRQAVIRMLGKLVQ